MVYDYHDVPRRGIADLDGRAHLFQSIFDDARDEWTDMYDLHPIDAETYQLAIEDWQIWLRWESAFRAGQTTRETHPALPAERARHEELSTMLDDKLRAALNKTLKARAVFRQHRGGVRGGNRDALEVQWNLVPF